MNIDQFWTHISDSRTSSGIDVGGQTEQLRAALLVLPSSESVDFQRHLNTLGEGAYRWDLWGAAYLLLDGCSDDSFSYFCTWLICQGQKAYEAAIADPDSLAELNLDLDDLEQQVAEAELVDYLAGEVYEELTGEEMPYEDAETSGDGEPQGEPWDEDDEDALRARFPRIAAQKQDG